MAIQSCMNAVSEFVSTKGLVRTPDPKAKATLAQVPSPMIGSWLTVGSLASLSILLLHWEVEIMTADLQGTAEAIKDAELSTLSGSSGMSCG